jgi:DNA invertase Pin-like site-specific DNA recombinase
MPTWRRGKSHAKGRPKAAVGYRKGWNARKQLVGLSLKEKIDTSSTAGELVFHVFGAIAQFERRLIAERTRDGMNAARAKGSKPGRPALDQEKLNAALMLMKGGMSPTQAALQTGLGRSTVYRETQSGPNA